MSSGLRSCPSHHPVEIRWLDENEATGPAKKVAEPARPRNPQSQAGPQLVPSGAWGAAGAGPRPAPAWG